VSDDLSIPSPTYRVPRHSRGMDPATRRLALIAGGLGGTLLAIIGGWSVMGHGNTAVPIIQADSRPIRVKPESPGGMQIPGSNEDLSGGADTNGGRLAPPPEAPAPQALLSPPPTPLQPAVVAAPAPTPVPATPPTAAAKATAEKPVAPADRRVVTPAPEHAAPAVPAARTTLVQLAAVTSEEAARSEWQRLEKRMPDLFVRRQPAFSKTERGGHTLWRVRTGGFSDVAQAAAFCERVRAKGTSCSIADF
jgi:cell division septation protein DedD